MKYAVLFCALGLVTFVAVPWAAYGSFSFLAVGAAYAGLGPRMFGKRGGRLPWWSWVLFAPYLGLTALAYAGVRAFSREDASNEVFPGVHLGRRLTQREAQATEYAAILDLTSELTEPRAFREHAGYKCIALLDATAPTQAQLSEGVAHVTRDGPVYVHCAAGHGRSATFVAALGIARGDVATPEEAEAACRAARPAVGLKRVQRAALRAFAS